jgi:hypothetical protein
MYRLDPRTQDMEMWINNRALEKMAKKKSLETALTNQTKTLNKLGGDLTLENAY